MQSINKTIKNIFTLSTLAPLLLSLYHTNNIYPQYLDTFTPLPVASMYLPYLFEHPYSFPCIIHVYP